MMDDNFSKMMTDLKKQSTINQFGEYWTNYSENIIINIQKYGLADFRSNIKIADGFCDVLNIDPFHNKNDRLLKNKIKNFISINLVKNYIIKKFICEPYSRLVNDYKDAYILSESKYIELKYGDKINYFLDKHSNISTTNYTPSDYIFFHGIKIGKSYLNSILAYKFLSNKNIANCKVMMEIGGGFGANVHVILSVFPNIKKVIYVDIPPILYIGTQYLKKYIWTVC